MDLSALPSNKTNLDKTYLDFEEVVYAVVQFLSTPESKQRKLCKHFYKNHSGRFMQ